MGTNYFRESVDIEISLTDSWRCVISCEKLSVLSFKLQVMEAQGFNKIENSNDPRYLEYRKILEMFKVLSQSSDDTSVERRRKVQNE